jgi:hypothetical protein
MMEAARTSETSVDIQLRTRQYIPEDSEIHTRRRESLKCHMYHITSIAILLLNSNVTIIIIILNIKITNKGYNIKINVYRPGLLRRAVFWLCKRFVGANCFHLQD